METKERKTTERRIKNYSWLTLLGKQEIQVVFCKDFKEYTALFRMREVYWLGDEAFWLTQIWFDGQVKLLKLSIVGDTTTLTILGPGNTVEAHCSKDTHLRDKRTNSGFYIIETRGLEGFLAMVKEH